MGIFEGTQGEWGQNPQFPIGRGAWIPLRLFKLSHQVNVYPELALSALLTINASPSVNAEAVVELSKKLGLAMSSSITSDETLSLAGEFHLALQQAVLVDALVEVEMNGVKEISPSLEVDFSSSMTLRAIRKLQAEMRVIAQQSSKIVRLSIVKAQRSVSATGTTSLFHKAIIRSSLVFSSYQSCEIGFPYAPPVTTEFQDAGQFTYTIPKNVNYIDVVLLGGGASGQTGSGSNNSSGVGGRAGYWAGFTFRRGGNTSYDYKNLYITVPSGGGAPANSDKAGPIHGFAAKVAISATAIPEEASGGDGGHRSGSQNGESPGNFVFNGVNYYGGTGGTGNGGNATNPPGGGGAGGNGGIFGSRTRGGYGARGYVSVRAYQ